MKRINFAIGLLITLVIQSGCNQTTESQPTTAATNAPAVSQTGTPAQTASYAYETGSKKKGDTGLCVICVVDEGSTMEEEANVEADDELDDMARRLKGLSLEQKRTHASTHRL